MSYSDLETSLDIRPEGPLEDGPERDGLVFPINVHESLAASNGLKQREKRGIILSFWVVGNLILIWFLAGWLRQLIPQYYFLIVVLAELFLQATVGTFLLRFILDEGTMISEMQSKDNSFAKYFGIYHEHLAEEETAYPFDTIEFADGSYGVYIQCLMGYNTNRASANTYTVNGEIQQLINKSGMSHRVVYSNEKFSNSSAAAELRKVVAGVEDPKLFKAYREILQGLLVTANEQSNVMCTTYIIYAKTRIQKEDLRPLVDQILGVVRSEETAYREVVTLSYQDIVEFYRNYYKLDVLDMGLIRVHQAAKKAVSCPVKVLKVYGKSGKVYTTPDFNKTKKQVLQDFGLEQVN